MKPMNNQLTSTKKKTKKKIKSWLVDRLFSHSGDDYQRTRYPNDKFVLISSQLNLSEVNNVLDVGCNEGYISAEFAKRGKFCVAIDAGPYFLNHILNDLDSVYGRQNPAFGVFPLAEENINLIPEFDLVLLLSVHHQWINTYGDDYAKRLATRLIDKARRYFVIEFAATAKKYGFKESKFEDNDEESVKTYAESWLHGLNVPGTIEYIGKNQEGNANEPYRFIFMITKDHQ
jgi:SAM-dependent methyltransferase